MKKLLLISLLFLASTASAQKIPHKEYELAETRPDRSESFGRDVCTFSIALGVPNLLSYNNPVFGHPQFYSQSEKSFGPLILRFEARIKPSLGLAAIFQFATKDLKGYYISKGPGSMNITGSCFGLMGFYHFNKFVHNDKFDFYAGAGGGLSTQVTDGRLDDQYGSGTNKDAIFLPLGLAGVRFHVNEQFSAFLEGGLSGYSYVNLGLSFRVQRWPWAPQY